MATKKKKISENQETGILHPGHPLTEEKTHVPFPARTIAIKPLYAGAWSRRGISLHNLGRYEDAVVSCDKSIAINPDYSDAW
jgi:tetratricopeptide (TPR) repeat protein